MHKYVRRGLTAAVLSGGLVLLGTAVVSAETGNSNPLGGLGDIVHSVEADTSSATAHGGNGSDSGDAGNVTSGNNAVTGDSGDSGNSGSTGGNTAVEITRGQDQGRHHGG